MRWPVLLLGLVACDRVFDFTNPTHPDAAIEATRWRAVALGDYHGCGIHTDRTLWCWGRNGAGQLGEMQTGADFESDLPRQIGTGPDWDTIAAAANATCAITLDHALWCWGDVWLGGTGFVQEPGSWAKVAVGRNHACAIDMAGGLSCWGTNSYGMLGDGTVLDHTAPAPVLGGATWTDVAAGEEVSCGIQDGGTAWCWGGAGRNQIGNGGVSSNNPMPLQVGTDTYAKIASAGPFVCAIRTDGKLRCWGADEWGQLGNGAVLDTPMPQPVGQDLASDWTSIVTGYQHACARRAGGEVMCWGNNQAGQLVSDPTKPFRTAPQTIEDDHAWEAIAAGTAATCAIDADGLLACAGDHSAGNLGDGSGSQLSPAEVVSPAGAWKRLTAGDRNTCAQSAESLYCWGYNHAGAVGDGTVYNRQEPALVAGAFAGASTSAHTCAIKTDGTMACWGDGGLGAIGNGMFANPSAPAAVTSGDTFLDLSASYYNTCGVAATRLLYCWGHNNYGQTGANAGDDLATPYQLTTSGWEHIAVGAFHACGILGGGTVACFGYGLDGQLGQSSPIIDPIPHAVTLPTQERVDQIVSGDRFSCARSGGLAWCWGDNDNGQLGDMTTNRAYTPHPLPMMWKELAAGQEHMCGVDTGGALWCWGNNAWGQLGDGTFAEHHEPTRVGMDSDWDHVAVGTQHSCASKGDKVFCWGGNTAGELGLAGRAWRAKLQLIDH